MTVHKTGDTVITVDVGTVGVAIFDRIAAQPAVGELGGSFDTIRAVVPPGRKPGGIVSLATPSGGRAPWVVPPNAKPGDAFTVSVPSGAGGPKPSFTSSLLMQAVSSDGEVKRLVEATGANALAKLLHFDASEAARFTKRIG